MSLFKQNEYFYRVKFFLTELSFLKRDTNIYFEYITLFEGKKIFPAKNKIYVKIHIFFLKRFFFQIVLLHLNNHSLLLLSDGCVLTLMYTFISYKQFF